MKKNATDNNSNNGNVGKVSFDRSRAKNPDNTSFDPNEYFWTHIYGIHFNHINARCKYKSEGRKTEATRVNTMGGKSKNKYWVKGL